MSHYLKLHPVISIGLTTLWMSGPLLAADDIGPPTALQIASNLTIKASGSSFEVEGGLSDVLRLPSVDCGPNMDRVNEASLSWGKLHGVQVTVVHSSMDTELDGYLVLCERYDNVDVLDKYYQPHGPVTTPAELHLSDQDLRKPGSSPVSVFHQTVNYGFPAPEQREAGYDGHPAWIIWLSERTQ